MEQQKQLHSNGIVVITKDISWVWIVNGSNKEITILGKFDKPEGGTANIKIKINKVVMPKGEEKNWILSGQISPKKLITINYSEKDQQARYVLTDAPQETKFEDTLKGTIFEDIFNKKRWPF